MDGQEFTDAVRDDHETALSRLGSSKWVYALTGGEMDGDAVAAAWAAEAGAASETFAGWADDESDGAAADVFADVARTAADHGDDADSADDAGDPHRPMYGALAGLETTVERTGGLLAWALVAEQTLAQFVGFFVGDADPSSANTFRDRRSDLQDERERAEALLDDVCDDDADWEAARAAADQVVDAAYDDYVETLESMGIKPKNVC
jgi:hypothetical protein